LYEIFCAIATVLRAEGVILSDNHRSYAITPMRPWRQGGNIAGVREQLIRPMLAIAGHLPSTGGERWAAEMKWDGVRAVAYLRGATTRLFSRNDRDISPSYPELLQLHAAVGRDAVLDGEIVAMDERGRPNFGLLQSRMHVADPAKVRAARIRVPVSYLLFDLLSLDGHLLLQLQYLQRRELLERLELTGDHVAVPPVFVGQATAAMRASRDAGLEGVVCKRLDSVYTPGRRSPAWVKVKRQRTQEVVIVGWEPGEGRRADMGALLLGVHVAGELRYVGQVGTGFTDDMLVDLRNRLAPLRVPAPAVRGVPDDHARRARWVRPELVGEVAFGEWTAEARLRHPSWRGLRPDKAAADVVREL
jgi:bifunctional non-homologous end joining protein LigD